MNTFKYIGAIALAAFAINASAQTATAPGTSVWTPSGDATVHRSVSAQDANKVNSNSDEATRAFIIRG